MRTLLRGCINAYSCLMGISRMSKRSWLVVLALAVVSSVSLPAQLRVRPVADETGEVALQLLFRKLHNVGTFMMTTAHPDDENNGLLAQITHGLGLRTVLVSATRGDGGQNEIGPEIFDALAVLRTEELLAAHRFDGPEQLFTRAVDFGYSFSLDETYEKWGKDEIIGDYVHHIRATRPDLIVGFLWEGTGGGQHHQASTHLSAEAYRAAADPTRYPEQMKDGLRPWQAKKFYYTSGPTPTTSGEYDPVLGRTYDEIGAEGRSMHKCQSVAQLLPLPTSGTSGIRGGYTLLDTVIPGQLQAHESSLLDGIDVSWMSLLQFAAATPAATLPASLSAISRSVDDAEAAFKSKGMGAAVAGLAAGLHDVRALRAGLGRSGLSDAGQYEIDFRLAQKERQFQDALVIAMDVRLEAIGDDPVVTPSQTVHVQLIVGNRGPSPVTVTGLTTTGFTAPAACQTGEVARHAALSCNADLRIPSNAKPSDITFRHDPTAGARYIFDPSAPFGAPFTPTPFRGQFGLTIAGEGVQVDLPIEARYSADVFAGEKRSELLVTPALTVTLSPDVVVMPTGIAAKREVRVTVRNNSLDAATGSVRLRVPAGWSVDPASVPVSVGRADEEASARFTITPPAGARAGEATISAEAATNGATFGQGYQVVEYPHTRRRLLFHPATAAVKLVDVKVAPNLRVGYVMGVGDQVPQAIAQLGVPVSLIGSDELSWGDLSKYSTIMLGVRAYERRADLRANNQRMLDYARNGGVVLLNYARTEFNAPGAQYGPYPAQTTSERTTDENAPVRILVPDHPVFTTPNTIGPATWANWVQERGTYYLGRRDPQYVDLLESEDPFPYNAGPKRGILVEARVGKGRWIYIGLVLWRELPAGVPGAYQLLANLISIGSLGH
jgi:LmbE family N-acetylglucosaminyl deacetylase